MAYNFTCIECKSCKYHQQEMTALRSIKHASNVISCAYRASAFCGAMIVSVGYLLFIQIFVVPVTC
uniref:Uncharacterized protein LOC105638513 isoform X2 n=1 Tax=Rhizophora mucronata TaxID=61149 RepID=A0A2P2MG69_RHIMU